jgi:preprotein translocase subunit SecE
MSAPRRTGTKSQPGAASTVAARPPVPAPEAPPRQRPAKTSVEKKGETERQPSVFASRLGGIRKLARETWSEANKVNWPDKETTRNLTAVVIGISVVLGLFLGGIDYVMVRLLDLF